MRTLKFLMLAANIFTIQMLAAQNPAISTRYSDSEIAKIVEQYRAVHSQNTVPSSSLQQKFQADFPKASDIEWETANGIYEVEFEIRFHDFKAFYDNDGNLLMVVEEIRNSALPAVVQNTAKAKYPKFMIEDIRKIRRGTETVYKLEMEKSFSDMEVTLFVKSNGIVLNEQIDY
ncbi:MAG: PepSY-like domain-containing protein [Paludibacter sp.]|nr:PepSY-like domain-containing protein [Paludibacter sp.]